MQQGESILQTIHEQRFSLRVCNAAARNAARFTARRRAPDRRAGCCDIIMLGWHVPFRMLTKDSA